MKTKIGVFGDMETVHRVRNLAENYSQMELLPFFCSSTSEVMDKIERAFMCDMLLFTDYCSYQKASEKIKKKQTLIYVDYDEYTFLSSILRLKTLYSLNRISTDVPKEIHINDLLQDMQMSDIQVHAYEYEKNRIIPESDIAFYHLKLYNEGKIDGVLTSKVAVLEYLKAENVPVYQLQLPNKNIIDALEKTQELIDLAEHYSTQLVTGIISIKEGDKITQNQINELNNCLNVFSDETDAMLIPCKNNHFLLVGTKKLLQNLKNHYRDFPLIQEMEGIVASPVNIGFGFGLTPSSSLKHAQQAHSQCNAETHSISYIVNERQETIGPIGIKRDIDTSKLFHALIHKARLNNELSYNFIDFIIERNNEPFSSNDIADFYKVTKRSAERTVNKLLTGDVIRVAGEERPYLKGRPRKLFSLKQ
ncbi:hypothetical protein [Oceanobacillus iheyensis HTE831]|uniref:Transcriptional regulator n=1 Tax=Oceanobacillus iheyensis (strain DSM 14371 / CIP 107618 / JCM 11309 / KCTC 3954 / HTE831) TaxID=221109 RepID=Q8ELZ0_OCEIH|nr:hypothetical protein [Oceanobacillus iheyensis]BAC15029.1 hypothetical protein [Oceanobacillus iheyensis HTE831]